MSEELNKAIVKFASHVYEVAQEHRGWDAAAEGDLRNLFKSTEAKAYRQGQADEHRLVMGMALTLNEPAFSTWSDNRLIELELSPPDNTKQEKQI